MKIRRVKGVVAVILLVVMCSSIHVMATGSKSWNIEHPIIDAYFYGNVTFSERSWPFKSVVTYFARISGTNKDLCIMSVNSNDEFYRRPSDQVGTLLISTKNRHNGNCVTAYAASNHQIGTTQYKDYLTMVNVDLQFGTTSSYVSEFFTVND